MLQTNSTLPVLKTEIKAKNKSASVVRGLHGGKTRTPRLTSGEFDTCGNKEWLRSNNRQTFHGAGSATLRVGVLVLRNDDKGE